MTYGQGILLGIIQGVAEFLPISSSGHLFVLRELLGLGDVPKLFDIILHIATLLVVIYFYRKRIFRLLRVFFSFILRKNKDEDQSDLRMILFVIISTLLTGVLGLSFEALGFTENLILTSVSFIVTGVILLSTGFFRPRRTYGELKYSDSLLIGAAQGLGTIPGVSRSGITISAAMMGGVDRETAGEYSFIISLPAIMGALILDLKDGVALLNEVSPPVMIVSFIITAMAGYLSLNLLVRLLRKGSFHYFSFYLIPLGIIILFFLV